LRGFRFGDAHGEITMHFAGGRAQAHRCEYELYSIVMPGLTQAREDIGIALPVAVK
jgi:hypothetical protein